MPASIHRGRRTQPVYSRGEVPSFVRLFPAVTGLLLTAGAIAGQPGGSQAPAAAPALTLEAVAARAAAREADTLQSLKVYRPILEVYLQRLGLSASGEPTVRQDSYLLGRFNWFKGPRFQDPDGRWEAPEMALEGVAGERLGFRAHGFAATLAPDWRGLDPVRYTHTHVRRETLGEARCFVIDLTPKKRDDGFVGRIWVEDRTFQIVRFNGINRAAEREHFGRPVRFNVDGWRANVLPGLWLPSYVYVEEATEGDAKAPGAGSLRSQIRLWGYDPRTPPKTSGPAGSHDPAGRVENDLLERLIRAKLLATRGAVEDVLDTVLRNLLAANGLSLEQPVHVRVLLTAPLESFTVGHTLVLSRGLVDVVPDETTLAFMLAHELAHVLLGHQSIDTLLSGTKASSASADTVRGRLRASRTPIEEAAASDKAIELLRSSPYRDGLTTAAAFLRTVTSHANPMANFIEAGISSRLGGSERLHQLANAPAPAGDGANSSAPAALPPGARLALDPWSSRLSLIPNAAQAAGRGLAPLVITPLIPHVAYATAPPLDYRP